MINVIDRNSRLTLNHSVLLVILVNLLDISGEHVKLKINKKHTPNMTMMHKPLNCHC